MKKRQFIPIGKFNDVKNFQQIEKAFKAEDQKIENLVNQLNQWKNDAVSTLLLNDESVKASLLENIDSYHRSCMSRCKNLELSYDELSRDVRSELLHIKQYVVIFCGIAAVFIFAIIIYLVFFV